jgi:CubicO group peptidase (beta-lactamase class C family)
MESDMAGYKNPVRILLILMSSPVLLPVIVGGAEKAPRRAEIAERVEEFIASKEVAGAVTLVAGPGDVLHLDATGLADVAQKQPMRTDTIFWIASMTKPITATALLMLQDEGKLSIEDSVGQYLPELAHLKTSDGTTRTVAIRHILTHTSGMADITDDEARPARKLADLIPAYASKPLGFVPGSRWSYCQSGINTAARIVEVVSGMPFDQFLAERLFEPLKMKDTTFYLSQEQMGRLAKSYRRNEGGSFDETPVFVLLGKSPTYRDRYPPAHGGLFSTAPDYLRFCQMILNGGELDGQRYLKPESVALMTGIHTGLSKTGFTEGNGWGLGWCVVRQPQGVTAMLSPGTHGHGGVYGTQAWIDPQKKRIYILMVQRANFPNADDSLIRRAFQEAAAKIRR